MQQPRTEQSVCFYAVTMRLVAWTWGRCRSSRCVCQVRKSDHCRARAVSAHSTCGLVHFDLTRPSSKGSPPVRKHRNTHTHAERTYAQNQTEQAPTGMETHVQFNRNTNTQTRRDNEDEEKHQKKRFLMIFTSTVITATSSSLQVALDHWQLYHVYIFTADHL